MPHDGRRAAYSHRLDATLRYLGACALGGYWALALAVGVAHADIVTPHDTFPEFAASPNVRSAANGPAELTTTWDCSCIPDGDDIVLISHDVTAVDLEAAVIGVSGSLTLLNGVQLEVGTLQVVPGGELLSDGAISGEIIIKDAPLNSTSDPNQYGTGILVIDGAIHLQGLPKTPFVRLTAEHLVNDVTLDIATTGWQAGDKLIIPDTREVRSGVSQRDLPIVGAVTSNSIILASALQYNHYGARDQDDVLRFLPHVGNLSRSLVIRSANPSGTRGHILITGLSDADLRYVELRNLGRTTEAPLDSITNHIGRYPLHFHHLHGVLQPNGYQFTAIGNAIDDARKWGIAIHGSHYGLVQSNVIHDAVGAAIATEDGTETGNFFDGNFAVYSRGSGSNPNNYQRPTSFLVDNGHEGSCFWFRAQGNKIKNNVAANCRWAGYNFFARYGNIGVTNAQPIPLKQGSAATQILDTRRLIPWALDDNEAYASERGLETWYEFATIVKGFGGWHISKTPMYLYYGAEGDVDGLIAIGDGVCEDGFLSEQGLSLVAKNFDIQGCVGGFQIKPLKKSVILTNAILRNAVNLNIVPGDVPLQKPIQFVNVALDGVTCNGLWTGAVIDNSGPYTHPWSIMSSLEPEQVVFGTVTITVTRAGPINDGKIDFYISGKSVKSDNSSPYNYVWNTTTWANGPHWIQLEWAGSTANPGLRDWKAFRVVVNNP